jgi:hypothetical protein
MKLTDDAKCELQAFVYFFFKGTMAFGKLLGADIDYLQIALANRQVLYHCFEIFAAAPRNGLEADNFSDAEGLVADYLVALHRGDADAYGEARPASPVSTAIPFWQEFLRVAHCFCYNSFPLPLKEDYVLWLDGSGTDAVPIFAVWSNVLEVDKNQCPLNADYALKRANDRLLLWDGVKESPPFAEWELEQEIY